MNHEAIAWQQHGSRHAASTMTPDAYATAPKVELHLHLEGAIPVDAMWELVARHGGDREVPRPADLVAKLRYRDFPHFIETWTWMTQYLRAPEDFAFAAEAAARSLAAQHIVYAEASISPTDYTRHGSTVEEIVVATRRGLDRVDGASVSLIVDLVRDTGPEQAARTLGATIDVAAEAGVVGITIGGSEHEHPPGPFASVYRRANEAGLHLTAHAGEAAGPGSVAAAVEELGVERIGHGVRAVENGRLLARLVDMQIPFEVCPTSNLRTGVATDWERHPVHALLDAGAFVTISSDDPTYFHCDLAGELRTLAELRGASARDLTLAAVEASWLDTERKAELAAAVRRYWRDAAS